jgi:hypothetical protein
MGFFTMPTLAALLLFLTTPTPVPAQDDVDPVVARFVATARQGVGLQVNGLMRVTGVRGEGRTLILVLELAAEAPELLEPPHVASMIATSICADANGAAFFGGGRALQVQVSGPRRPAQSVTIDRCPGPVGEGLTAAAFAAGLQTFVGLRDGDMTIAAVRAEGNMMIVTLAYPADSRVGAASNSEGFVQGFCARPEVGPAFFGRELILRVDTRIGDGEPMPGPAVTACPAR